MGEWVKIHSTSTGERTIPDSTETNKVIFTPLDQGVVTFSAKIDESKREDISILGYSLKELGLNIDNIPISAPRTQ